MCRGRIRDGSFYSQVADQVASSALETDTRSLLEPDEVVKVIVSTFEVTTVPCTQSEIYFIKHNKQRLEPISHTDYCVRTKRLP